MDTHGQNQSLCNEAPDDATMSDNIDNALVKKLLQRVDDLEEQLKKQAILLKEQDVLLKEQAILLKEQAVLLKEKDDRIAVLEDALKTERDRYEAWTSALRCIKLEQERLYWARSFRTCSTQHKDFSL